MNDLVKSHIAANDAVIKQHQNSLALKVVSYLLAFVVIGAVVCIIIGILKTAVDALVIVGAVLLLISLFILWIYHAMKANVAEHHYKKLLDKYQEKDSTEESD